MNRILLDILIVLLAAKLAAEIADRVGVPAVVGEIVAGVVIGPSVLGIVHTSEALQTLAQLGVILLLLEVGLEMDLADLGSVGRASVTVAVVGVVVPLIAGAGTGIALGMSGKEAVFVGAALTATSVGITARVFGDLRALATIEAKTVLGAAVADDILGLVILTVVARIVTEGSVSFGSVASVVLVALAFVIVTTLVGVRIIPPAFALIRRHSRSSGTLVAVALAFTLGVAELAHAAQLAPIVGAFVAGIALSRSSAADRVRRELSPVGHLLIPVFFLQIGIDADVTQFGRPSVLGIAGALLVVAVLGKLASIVGLFGAPGDRLLVGIGMIPRGEVGLIFATLGLRQHVFGEDVYAALLLVVLVTTVGTPPLLRLRWLAMRAARDARPAPAVTAASGSDFVCVGANGAVELVAEPLPSDALVGALTIARLAEHHGVGDSAREWLDSFPPGVRRFDGRARDELWRLLHEGGPRSWRLLTVTGVLQRSLPELDDALARGRDGVYELDPLSALRFARLDAVRQAVAQHDEGTARPVLLAALVLDACDGSDVEPVVVARRTMHRLDLGAHMEQAVAGITSDAGLLSAACRRVDALEPEAIMHLAIHLETVEHLDALALFTRATSDDSRWVHDRLEALYELVRATLAHPDLVDRGASYEVDRRRQEAAAKTLRRSVKERVLAAPRDYILSQGTEDIIRHAQLCEPSPRSNEVRVRVDALESPSRFRVEVATHDRIGLIARVTHTLFEAGCSVESALAATWGDGAALSSYGVTAAAEPDERALERALQGALTEPVDAPPAPGVEVVFDDEGSPFYTRCTATGADRVGLLRTLTAAFATAGASVHAARITTEGSTAVDTFDLTDRAGRKLDTGAQTRIRAVVAEGVTPRPRRFSLRRGSRVTRPFVPEPS